MANPKAFVAIGAVYSSHTLVADDLVLDTVSKLLALSLVILIVNSAWLAFGASFARLLNRPVIARAVNYAFSAMLVLSVGWVFFGAWRAN